MKAGPLAAGLKELVQNFRSVPGVIEWVNDTFDRLFEEEAGLQPANVRLERRRLRAGARPPAGRGRPRSRPRGERRRASRAGVGGGRGDPPRRRRGAPSAGPSATAPPASFATRPGATSRSCSRAAPASRPTRRRSPRSASPTATRAAATTSSARRSATSSSSCSAIDDPRDRVSLVGALRSGAFGCSDDDLVIHAATAEAGGPWNYRAKPESESERVMEAFDFLRQLHYARAEAEPAAARPAGSGREPPGRGRAHRPRRPPGRGQPARDRRAGPRPSPPPAAAARARSCAGSPTTPSARRSEVDAGIAEETDDVVRIMTMHGAKGLEFPIVVLGGLGGKGQVELRARCPTRPTAAFTSTSARQRAARTSPPPATRSAGRPRSDALELEDVRLLYVAATRARDHLVIPDFQAKKPGGRCSRSSSRCCPRARPTRRRSTASGCSTPSRLEHPPPVEEERRKVKAAEAKAALAEREAWQAEREALDQGRAQGPRARGRLIASSEASARSPPRPRTPTRRCS